MKKLMKFTMSLPVADACFYFSVIIQKEFFVGRSIIKRVQSNQINRQTRLFNSKAIQQCSTQNLTMDPWFVTGFTDAEGSFILSIVRNKELKVGWRVQAIFEICLSQKDQALLE